MVLAEAGLRRSFSCTSPTMAPRMAGIMASAWAGLSALLLWIRSLTAADWTAAATGALVICALLQAAVLILQWKTLKRQTAFQSEEQARQRVRASERARLVATLIRRSLLETYRTLDRASDHIDATPMDTFREMAIGLGTVETQLQQVADYLAEAAGARNTEMDEAVTAFLRAADVVNQLCLGPGRLSALITMPERKVAAQDAREDVRRAVLHLEKATGLPRDHALSPAL